MFKMEIQKSVCSFFSLWSVKCYWWYFNVLGSLVTSTVLIINSKSLYVWITQYEFQEEQQRWLRIQRNWFLRKKNQIYICIAWLGDQEGRKSMSYKLFLSTTSESCKHHSSLFRMNRWVTLGIKEGIKNFSDKSYAKGRVCSIIPGQSFLKKRRYRHLWSQQLV